MSELTQQILNPSDAGQDAEQEERLERVAQKLYQTSDRRFSPMFPWVFLRVLPKSQVTAGGIHLPAEQNKTVHEGVVLATWRSYTRYWTKGGEACAEVRRSELAPGDHVIFPHWSGIPIPGFSEKNYRLVKEHAWAVDKEGGIFATVEYEDTGKDAADAVVKLVWEGFGQLSRKGVVESIRERFIVLDKRKTSVLVSGR